jgi:uncharacterized protein with HEPN domain
MRSFAICKRWRSRVSVLPIAIKASEPDVPWRAISGFRNILVHDYLAIDVDAVWLVVEQEFPRLRVALKRMEKRAQVA